jgi:hypothetical protein
VVLEKLRANAPQINIIPQPTFFTNIFRNLVYFEGISQLHKHQCLLPDKPAATPLTGRNYLLPDKPAATPLTGRNYLLPDKPAATALTGRNYLLPDKPAATPLTGNRN